MTAVIIPVKRAVYIEKHIHIIECAACSVDFGIGDDFMARRRKDHGVFYCPNGHQNYYSGDNAEEAAKKEAERLARVADSLRASNALLRDQRAAARRQATAYKGVATRVKNRADKGVCQHCNRSFSNVARHVAHMHGEVSS
jgi:hypothetical protein